jgi:hypothetical protein
MTGQYIVRPLSGSNILIEDVDGDPIIELRETPTGHKVYIHAKTVTVEDLSK